MTQNNIYHLIETSELIKVAKAKLGDEYVTSLLNELKEKLEETYFQEYHDNQSVGQVAKKFSIPIGSIGCPNCGVGHYGSLVDVETGKFVTTCSFCGVEY